MPVGVGLFMLVPVRVPVSAPVPPLGPAFPFLPSPASVFLSALPISTAALLLVAQFDAAAYLSRRLVLCAPSRRPYPQG